MNDINSIPPAVLLAQTAEIGWTLDGVAKVGLGVASFVALVGGGGYLIRWLLTELKESRKVFATAHAASQKAFLEAIEKQHADHAREIDELHAWAELRDEKLRTRLHEMANAVNAAVAAIEMRDDRREKSRA